jgi:hypothetical protein
MSDDIYTNLLVETLECLRCHGLGPQDVRFVRWVCGEDLCHCTIDEFSAVASHRYDAGFGSPNITDSLLVVGDGWWLERHEYDGSEWWEFKTLPCICGKHKAPSWADLCSEDPQEERTPITKEEAIRLKDSLPVMFKEYMDGVEQTLNHESSFRKLFSK